MSSFDRKRQLFENVVRLRRAGRELPQNPDIAAVRAAMEAQLGDTVSQRLAASLLGVSHTALGRWVKAGDLPVVETDSGRIEVPVAALLDLHEAVEAERRRGERTRHVLEPAMREARERASRMAVDDVTFGETATADPHRRAELRSLAYHRALAGRLRRPMVDEARYVVGKWRDEHKIDERYATRWDEVLARPTAEIAKAIAEDTPEASDLRQNSPFAGMLSEPERRKILELVR
jgi:hypothetical protein